MNSNEDYDQVTHLVLITGDVVQVYHLEYDDFGENGLLDKLLECLEKQSVFNISEFVGENGETGDAYFRGQPLEFIDMKKVIGMSAKVL